MKLCQISLILVSTPLYHNLEPHNSLHSSHPLANVTMAMIKPSYRRLRRKATPASSPNHIRKGIIQRVQRPISRVESVSSSHRKPLLSFFQPAGDGNNVDPSATTSERGLSGRTSKSVNRPLRRPTHARRRQTYFSPKKSNHSSCQQANTSKQRRAKERVVSSFHHHLRLKLIFTWIHSM